MTDKELKIEYAKILLREADTFKAALKLFPDNTARALRVSSEWPNDIEVLNAKETLIAEADDEDAFLPTKNEFSRAIWDKLTNEAMMPDDFAKVAKLYADVRGFISKPQTNVNLNNNSVSNKVMIVKDNGSDDAWEAKLQLQQEKLLNGS